MLRVYNFFTMFFFLSLSKNSEFDMNILMFSAKGGSAFGGKKQHTSRGSFAPLENALRCAMRYIFIRVRNLMPRANSLTGFTPLEKLKNVERRVAMRSLTGFTLIETLVGVVLLANIVIGPVVFLTTGFTHIKTAEDRLTALYLAQEGLELVRAIRDKNVLTDPDPLNWRAGLTANTYKMDFDDTGLEIYGGQYLLYNSANGIYSYNSGGVESKFRRQIQIADGITTDDFLVTVFVEWNDGTVLKTIQLSLRLYNWI